MSEMERFFERANQLLDRLESVQGGNRDIAFDAEEAWCWRFSGDNSRLEAIQRPTKTELDDLKCIDRQKDELETNTRQFIEGLPANNALLWGPRGTGKSSLIKALLNRYHPEGLRLIEIQRDDMKQLPRLCDALDGQAGRYLLFCDDLSFEENDPAYKAVKVILDGSVKSTPDNVIVYATSNRRHLLPEKMTENLESGIVDGDLHYGDTVEEKLSLSERFGLQISFHPFNQQQYLEIVNYWLEQHMGMELSASTECRRAALQWALQHSSRSGRCAMLFSRDWAGKSGLKRS